MAVVATSEQLRRISIALREAGERGNLNAMRRGIRADTVPMIAAARQAALTQMPKAGGLNEYEAGQKIRTAVLSGVKTTGVRIIGKASKATDTGTWRHPDPSMRGYDRSYWHWHDQTYGPAAGWWSKTLQDRAPEVSALITAQVKAVSETIARA